MTTAGRSAGNTIHYVIDNGLGVGLTQWPIGSGMAIDQNSVIAKYTYFGDVNLDGKVDDSDYGIVDGGFGSTPQAGLAVISGDANLDGVVSDSDYGIVDGNFGQGAGNPLSPALTNAVPESGSVCVIVLAVSATLTRRKRV